MCRGTEDKFPILVFCLLKAKIPCLWAEVDFLKELVRPNLLSPEEHYRLLEFEQAVLYIESLNWNIYDAEGILISVSSIQNSVKDTLRYHKGKYYKVHKEQPKVLWLAELVLHCGFHIGQNITQVLVDTKYAMFFEDPLYFNMAKDVYTCLYLELTLSPAKISVKHEYPQFVYSKIAETIEKEIIDG